MDSLCVICALLSLSILVRATGLSFLFALSRVDAGARPVYAREKERSKFFFARDSLLALISRSPDKAKEGFVFAAKNGLEKIRKFRSEVRIHIIADVKYQGKKLFLVFLWKQTNCHKK